MDPLANQIPPASGKLPPKPEEGLTGFDVGAYSGGGALFVASQLFSKSFPHLAEEVARNTVGADVNAAKGKFSITNAQGVMALAPAPFGFVPPEQYGLSHNYLYSIESRLKSYNAGLEVFAPPHSELLHTLPDYDPRVQFANVEERAKEQRQAAEKAIRGASIEQVLQLYQSTFNEGTARHFYRPEEIASTARAALIARTGGFPEYEATARQFAAVKDAEAELEQNLRRLPPARDFDSLAFVNGVQLAIDLAPLLGVPRGSVPVDPTATPPVRSDEQWTAANAKPPMKDVDSARNDP